ncbi:MAG: rod-binding protein [Proteobacteria bacterium]|nr:rod-binding protein [Pseudomonadota bacterium]
MIAAAAALKLVGGLAIPAKIATTALDFETQFTKSMLDQAMSGLTGEGPLGSAGPGGEAWRSFLVDEHAKAMTARGGLGIAAYVARDMARAVKGTLNASV